MNIYYSYTLDWPKPAVDRAVTQLPPLRREKAERYRRFEGRRESTAAVLLTLHALEASVTCSDEPMWREEPLSELIGQKGLAPAGRPPWTGRRRRKANRFPTALSSLGAERRFGGI